MSVEPTIYKILTLVLPGKKVLFIQSQGSHGILKLVREILFF